MKIIGLFLAITLAALAAGCSDKPVSTNSVDNQSLTARPIPPEVQELIDQNALNVTALAGDQSARSLGYNTPADNAQYDAYIVTFIWGSLLNVSNQSTILPITDWSGSLTAHAGGRITTTKTIAFESGQDYLLPVSTPGVVAWVSWTGAEFDGISSIVLLNRNSPAANATAITFATAPFTLRLTAPQMAYFAAYYQISNTSGIAVFSQKIPISSVCPSGIMAGHWIKSDVGGTSGSFSGLWMEQNGDTSGVFSGAFWTDSDGSRHFSGNVSGVFTDQIIAYLDGTWYYDDPRLCPMCGAGFGKFKGFFRYPDHNANDGVIKGEFGSLTLPPDQLDMPLSGVWAKFCYWTTPTADAAGQ